MAKRSKGADYLAKERGLSRSGPRLTLSTQLFEQQGNPWLTEEEKSKEFPLNRSRRADEPLSNFEARGRELRYKLQEALGRKTGDFPLPKPSIVVKPELDQFTKAEKALPKARYLDPKGTPSKSTFARRSANIVQKMNAALRAKKPIEYDDDPRKVQVKGSFYKFEDTAIYGRIRRVKK